MQENFGMAKTIRNFLETLFQYYFLNIIVNVTFFSELKFKYYCDYHPEMLPQVSLKQEIRTDGRGNEIFSGTFTGP